MPIFEYKCPQCGYINEVLVANTSVKAPSCPKCGAKKTEKQFSSFSAVVKENSSTSKCHTCPSSGGCPNFHG